MMTQAIVGVMNRAGRIGGSLLLFGIAGLMRLCHV